MREELKKKRKTAIREAAHVLLLQHGYNHTTIEDIADRVGCTTQTIYNYFSDKNAIVLEIIDVEDDKLYKNLRVRPANDYETAEDLIKHFLWTINLESMKFLDRDSWAAVRYDMILHKQPALDVAQNITDLYELMEQRLIELQRAGEIDKTADIAMISHIIMKYSRSIFLDLVSGEHDAESYKVQTQQFAEFIGKLL